MALRIGGAKKFPPQEEQELEQADAPVEEPMPEGEPYPEETPEATEEALPEEDLGAGGALDPVIAGYKGPEQGPFTCSNCVHFGAHGDRTCAIVSGDIDEMGLCNNFTTLSSGEEEMPEEEALPEEAPVEEPVEMPEEMPEEEMTE